VVELKPVTNELGVHDSVIPVALNEPVNVRPGIVGFDDPVEYGTDVCRFGP
jgi:hypothetical protein